MMAFSKKTHLRDNIDAIRLALRLESKNGVAMPDEAGILIRYSRFDGIELPTGNGLYCIIRKCDAEGFIRLRSCNSSCDAIEIAEKEITTYYMIFGSVNSI